MVPIIATMLIILTILITLNNLTSFLPVFFILLTTLFKILI
jgi:hypothetical protein